MAKHELVDLKFPEARCSCGWATRLMRPSTWGHAAGQNELLDQYNDHRRRPGPRWKRPDPPDADDQYDGVDD